jgi:hypothetical protein
VLGHFQASASRTPFPFGDSDPSITVLDYFQASDAPTLFAISFPERFRLVLIVFQRQWAN